MTIEHYFGAVSPAHTFNDDDIAVKSPTTEAIKFEKPLAPPSKWAHFYAALSNIPKFFGKVDVFAEDAQAVRKYKLQTASILRFKDFKKDFSANYDKDFQDLCSSENQQNDDTPLTARFVTQAIKAIECRMTQRNTNTVITFLEGKKSELEAKGMRAFVWDFVYGSLSQDKDFALSALKTGSIEEAFDTAQREYTTLLVQLDNDATTLGTILESEMERGQVSTLKTMMTNVSNRVNATARRNQIEKEKTARILENMNKAENARKAVEETEMKRVRAIVQEENRQKALEEAAQEKRVALVEAQTRANKVNQQKTMWIAMLNNFCALLNAEVDSKLPPSNSADKTLLNMAAIMVAKEIQGWSEDEVTARQMNRPDESIKFLLKNKQNKLRNQLAENQGKIEKLTNLTPLAKARLRELDATDLLLLEPAEITKLAKKGTDISESCKAIEAALRQGNAKEAARLIATLSTVILPPPPVRDLNDDKTRIGIFLSVALADWDRMQSLIMVETASKKQNKRQVEELLTLLDASPSSRQDRLIFQSIVAACGVKAGIAKEEDREIIEDRLGKSPSEAKTQTPTPIEKEKESPAPHFTRAPEHYVTPEPTVARNPSVIAEPEQASKKAIPERQETHWQGAPSPTVFSSILETVSSAIDDGIGAVAELFEDDHANRPSIKQAMPLTTERKHWSTASADLFSAQERALNNAKIAFVATPAVILPSGTVIDQQFYNLLDAGLQLKLNKTNSTETVSLDRRHWKKINSNQKMSRIDDFLKDLRTLCGNDQCFREVIAAASERNAATFLDAILASPTQTALTLRGGSAVMAVNAPRPMMSITLSQMDDKKIKMQFDVQYKKLSVVSGVTGKLRYNLNPAESQIRFLFNISVDDLGTVKLLKDTKHYADLNLSPIQPILASAMLTGTSLTTPPGTVVENSRKIAPSKELLETLRAFSDKEKTRPYLKILEASWLMAGSKTEEHQAAEKSLRTALNRLPAETEANEQRQKIQELLTSGLASKSEDRFAPLLEYAAKIVEVKIFNPCLSSLCPPPITRAIQ